MVDIQINKDGDHIEIFLKGDLDIQFREHQFAGRYKYISKFSDLTLDLKGIKAVDSMGIVMLLQFVARVKEYGIKLKIKNSSEYILEVFHILQIPEIIGEEAFVN